MKKNDSVHPNKNDTHIKGSKTCSERRVRVMGKGRRKARGRRRRKRKQEEGEPRRSLESPFSPPPVASSLITSNLAPQPSRPSVRPQALVRTFRMRLTCQGVGISGLPSCRDPRLQHLPAAAGAQTVYLTPSRLAGSL
jgi:hypothetical protein